ncbi:methyltransferase domain-containing protein [Sabulicella glaciei]|uniref:Class I SAM-dependent methyltransferase n=1 Tax=Sabulicella glaciei TaxID=2984948 RepID=A0ABT3NSZ8_9PROT|nr:class I SAM-dependent methyltransferase [Roseococcus sp. MDT2-1-1]MCW8085286.1 class I SAM-dependent methyltransferase [Roseococcus sp. MDT2-1-1]
MAEGFDGDWLALREPFDAAARDEGLARILAAHIRASRPHLLDLGAGTGSLTRWLAHFIRKPQGWTLADADPELMARAFDTMQEAAWEMGWAATWPGRKALLVHAPAGAWRIEGVLCDLAEAPHGLPLDKVQAVTCSALCDLVSEAWLERLAAALAARRLPFYAALNVSGRERFAPPHVADALVARGFARDQRRAKGFGGPALGPAAPAAIARAFARHGYAVHRAASPWRIHRREGEMAGTLAAGHAEAALAHERRDWARVEAWRAARLEQAARGRLAATVGHEDVLCLPAT